MSSNSQETRVIFAVVCIMRRSVRPLMRLWDLGTFLAYSCFRAMKWHLCSITVCTDAALYKLWAGGLTDPGLARQETRNLKGPHQDEHRKEVSWGGKREIGNSSFLRLHATDRAWMSKATIYNDGQGHTVWMIMGQYRMRVRDIQCGWSWVHMPDRPFPYH